MKHVEKGYTTVNLIQVMNEFIFPLVQTFSCFFGLTRKTTYTMITIRVSHLEEFFVRYQSNIPYIIGNHPSQADFLLDLPRDSPPK